MKVKKELSSVFLVFILCTIAIASSIFLIVNNKIKIISFETQFYVLRGMIFLYLFAIVTLFFRLLFYTYIIKLGKSIRFKMMTKVFHQPKIEGKYKDHYFQVHYCSRDGDSPSFIRTYVKMIFKKNIKFDNKKLSKIKGKHLGNPILCVKHIIRSDKNYLLVKTSPYIFEKNKLFDMMNYLIEISHKYRKE